MKNKNGRKQMARQIAIRRFPATTFAVRIRSNKQEAA
jgi:hypothetical protein